MYRNTTSESRVARAALLALAHLLGLGAGVPAAEARPDTSDERSAWAAPWSALSELLSGLFGGGSPRSTGLAAGGDADPNGLAGEGDHGPDMDPDGFGAEGDHGPDMDPDG
jgi:hypothetical protein